MSRTRGLTDSVKRETPTSTITSRPGLTSTVDSRPVQIVIQQVEQDDITIGLPQSLLRSSSAYVAEKFREDPVEAQNMKLVLTGFNVDIVMAYQDFLYRQKVVSKRRNVEISGGDPEAAADEEYMRLIKCYGLGECLLDSKFRNAVINCIIATSETHIEEDRYFPSGKEVKHAYAVTELGSPLRKLMVDMHVADGCTKWITDGGAQVHDHAFLYDLSVAFMSKRQKIEIGTIGRRDKYHVAVTTQRSNVDAVAATTDVESDELLTAANAGRSSTRSVCQPCRRLKVGCNRQRPCQRCEDADIDPEGCVDADEDSRRNSSFAPAPTTVLEAPSGAGAPLLEDHTPVLPSPSGSAYRLRAESRTSIPVLEPSETTTRKRTAMDANLAEGTAEATGEHDCLPCRRCLQRIILIAGSSRLTAREQESGAVSGINWSAANCRKQYGVKCQYCKSVDNSCDKCDNADQRRQGKQGVRPRVLDLLAYIEAFKNHEPGPQELINLESRQKALWSIMQGR